MATKIDGPMPINNWCDSSHPTFFFMATEIDGPIPEHIEPVDYAEGFYSSTLFAEQQPWAL